MDEREHHLQWWGVFGGATAAAFAVWMLVVPQAMDQFAWDVHPRLAQTFVGGGYIFRTVFFWAIARERSWAKVRWMFWGNYVFTGTLLIATYWHADEFTWGQFVPPTAHLWIVLYIFEPVSMTYLVPRGAAFRPPALRTGGPLLPWFRKFLVLEAGLLLMDGLLLLFNPEFVEARDRWAWPLNPLDARIMAAWLLGWSVWTGTMAFAADWDEIRLAARLNILCAGALLAAALANFGAFDFAGHHTLYGYLVGLAVLGGAMAVFHVLQERRRPPAAAG